MEKKILCFIYLYISIYLYITYILAKRRLYSQIKRLKKDPEMLDKHNQIMKEQQAAGIIEKVPKYNIPRAGKTYYMFNQFSCLRG